MKRILFFVLIFCSFAAVAQQDDVAAAKSLAERISPAWAGNITFEEITADSGKDVFEIASVSRKLVIRGNDVTAMAEGLNYYFHNYCDVDISWYRDEAPVFRLPMPVIPEKVRVEARCSERFFLNYCTFGYTMPWWQWSDWQWFIDWMVLNGINMPLAITGQESIWYNVWKKFGLTDKDIRSYFTGPAYLPWHRMSNIDHWDGPLPKSWLDNQFALQKKILARERELGMKPVLPAFAGHVPEALKKKFPNAKITSLGEWSGFKPEYDSYFLDPFDSLFKPIQKAFLQEQNNDFGTDHIYGTDPFNEVTPPSWEPTYLASVSKVIYGSMADVDPDAEWLQMGWIFYNQRDHWTNGRIRAYLDAVPIGKMTLLDYFCDNTEIWKITDSFYGQPYIWCYLGNFGGNTMMSGNLKQIEERMENTMEHGGDNMKGLGSTLEGFGVNPIMYEYVFDKAWSSGPVNVDDWVKSWSERRFGKGNDTVSQAWNILLNTTYSGRAGLGRATLTNARPALTGHNSWTTDPSINYDNKDLLKAWQLLASVKQKTPSVYHYDVVDVGRQILGNYFTVLRERFTECYNKKDMKNLKKNGDEMLALLNDMDKLLASNRNFLLGEWIESARKFGINAAEKNYYEEDARKLITVWGEPGGHLTDYANRSLAGLTKTYYRGRWKLFINAVENSLQKHIPFDEKVFTKQLTAFEDHWTKGKEKYTAQPVGDCMQISSVLLKRYAEQINAVRN